MFRKIALVAIAAIGLGAASIGTSLPAQAAPPGGGQRFFPHGGGYGHGGFGHGGYGHGGWGHGGYGRGRWYGGGGGWGGWGYGLPLYGFYGSSGYYDDYDYDYADCGYRRVHIRTRYGWRWARQRVCW